MAILPFLLALMTASAQDELPDVGELRKRFRSEGEADVRAELLREIAACAVEASEKVRKDARNVLAEGLEDDSYAVRSEGVRLLLAQDDREFTVPALCEAVESLQKELAALPRGGFGGGRGGGRGGGGQDLDPERAAQQAEAREKAQELNQYAVALIEGLATLPDDRCVDALVEVLERAQGMAFERIRGSLLQGLLQLGSRNAVAAIIEQLPQMAQPARRGRGAGGRGGGNTDREVRDSGGKDAHERLTRFVTERGLGEAPAWEDDGPREWAKWLAKNRKSLPAKLGKIENAKS